MHKVKIVRKDPITNENITFEYEINGSFAVLSFLGGLLSVILSSALNHSFWWGCFHFLCGWLYIIYAIICRSHDIWPALQAMFM